ncbi:MAG: hypothetical protein H6970_16240 [Gammaproteobacteria bacterium]|nr:hypothetical protein [Gammaproteobacteria bacterium]MCP5459160.1 hypothetical protein [Gammaproteobacteria bacterium]
MNVKFKAARVIAGILIGCLATTGVYAGSKGDRDSSRRGGNSDKAASAVRNATGGKVLGVRGGDQERDDYDVRVLLPDGRVRTLRFDPRTGHVSD